MSGLSEFDYLGKEDSDLARDEEQNDNGGDEQDGTRKSLEKDFEIAAEEDATEAESPIRAPTAVIRREEAEGEKLVEPADNE